MNNPRIKLIFFLLVTISILLTACDIPFKRQISMGSPDMFKTNDATTNTLSDPDTQTPTNSDTPTFTPSATDTLFPSDTPTMTFTPSETATPTETYTPSPTLTPTFAFPTISVTPVMAHCRYGPSKAYLHAADLYAGDAGQVRGRFSYSNWLRILLDKLEYQCWVSPSVIQVSGDITKINYQEVLLPGPSVLYPPPQNVRSYREGNQVTITWDEVWMTEDDDRGYFIEAFVCQAGAYIWYTVGDGTLTDYHHTTYTLADEAGCPWPSQGKLYGVEKHGYTTPVVIPWPKP